MEFVSSTSRVSETHLVSWCITLACFLGFLRVTENSCPRRTEKRAESIGHSEFSQAISHEANIREVSRTFNLFICFSSPFILLRLPVPNRSRTQYLSPIYECIPLLTSHPAIVRWVTASLGRTMISREMRHSTRKTGSTFTHFAALFMSR